MKIQIKRDEVSKDTKNHLKFKKKLRKMLMQRESNRLNSFSIDNIIDCFDDFDPLLDWEFRPVCGCELKGMESVYYNIKHNSLFGKNGYLLYEECISGCSGVNCASEGYELWLLDDLTLVFTYYCMIEDIRTDAGMIYRYPLGKKIPTDMELDAEIFLEELEDEIYSLRQPR